MSEVKTYRRGSNGKTNETVSQQIQRLERELEQCQKERDNTFGAFGSANLQINMSTKRIKELEAACEVILDALKDRVLQCCKNAASPDMVQYGVCHNCERDLKLIEASPGQPLLDRIHALEQGVRVAVEELKKVETWRSHPCWQDAKEALAAIEECL